MKKNLIWRFWIKEELKGKHLSQEEKARILQHILDRGIKIKQIWTSNRISMKTLYNIVGLYK